jgi:hypothetical protein
MEVGIIIVIKKNRGNVTRLVHIILTRHSKKSYHLSKSIPSDKDLRRKWFVWEV